MKSILLIGLGKFGMHLARELDALGHEIMGIDRNEYKVDEMMKELTNAQIGDSTNRDFLISLGIDNYDVCIVTIANNFQSSLETTCTLKELGAKLVVSCAESEIQRKFLLRNGADEVLYLEKQVAKWAAIRYSSEDILDYIELDDSHAIYEVTVPKQWVGKSIIQLDVRRKHNINIVTVKDRGNIIGSVSPDLVLTENMTLYVLGENKAIEKCFRV